MKNRLSHLSIALLVTLCSGCGGAKDQDVADDASVSTPVVQLLPFDHPFFSCSVCHGPKGEGNELLLAPRLAGQSALYLKKQIFAFQEGWRGADEQDVQGKIMADALVQIPSEQVFAALAYLDSLPDPEIEALEIAENARGKYLYNQSCSVCHGEYGSGSKVEAIIPRLDIQFPWYMEKQLENYRQRLRGFHPDDELGAAMGFYSQLLPDEQAVTDVIEWIRYLQQHKQ